MVADAEVPLRKNQFLRGCSVMRSRADTTGCMGRPKKLFLDLLRRMREQRNSIPNGETHLGE